MLPHFHENSKNDELINIEIEDWFYISKGEVAKVFVFHLVLL